MYYRYLIKYPIESIAIFATLIPIILLLTRSELKPPLRVLLYFLITKFAIELIKFHLASHRINSLLMGNLYVVLSLVFTCGIFYSIFLDDKSKRIIKYTAIGYVLIFSADFYCVNKDVVDLHYVRYVGLSLPLRSGIILVLCLLFFWELIQELYIEDITRSSIFFMVCGLFILHSVLLFSTIIYSQFLTWDNKYDMHVIIMMPYIFEIIFSIIVSIGVIRYKKTSYL